MNQVAGSERLVWSFWLAAGIAFIGGLWPLVFGGTSSRLAGAAIPFTIGAAAFAACGFLHRQGRLVTAVLYFVGGLALVYGVLAMFAVPLELAVLGSCPAPPAPCTGGFGRPLTAGENTGLGFGSGFALVAIFVGFFGLMVVFRRLVVPQAGPPPERKIPPLEPRPAYKPAPAPTPVAAEPAPEAEPEREPEPTPAAVVMEPEPEATNEPEPEPELPSHVEEELPELPPHESDTAKN